MQKRKDAKIENSPTLFVDGKRFSGSITSLAVYNMICGRVTDAVCDNVPAGISMNDGQSSPDEGCAGAGDDDSADTGVKAAQNITHYIITNDSPFNNLDKAVAATKKLFPKIDIRRIDYDSKEGQEMVKKYRIKYIPAYLFSENVVRHSNFEQIKNIVTKRFDAYLLRYDVMKSSIAIEREPVPGKLEVLCSSMSPKCNSVMKRLLDEVDNIQNRGITFHYMVVKNPEGEFTTRRGQPELEEDVRRLVIAKYFPDNLFNYLRQKVEDYQTTYWEDAVIAAGIDPKTLKRLARDEEKVAKMLADELDWLLKRNVEGDLVFYINDNEAVYLYDEDGLNRFISYINSGPDR